VNDLDYLNFHSLCSRRHLLDALFLINVYNGFKFCPAFLETVGMRVPVINCREFPLFTAVSSHKSHSSARCASAANIACKDID
jgi:hypothetical protein